jgi:hypothetical protein
MDRALYPFRYRDPVTGKWVRARYRATRETIARRHAAWEITGPPLTPAGQAEGFDPWRKAVPHTELVPLDEPPLQMDPELSDAFERLLVAAFLRRYVTWCARRGRYAQMNGAARLLRALPRVGMR